MNRKVCILLATFNGEKYIDQQLDSLLEQSVPADKILISDDGSTDNTWEILKFWQLKYPDKITLFKNDSPENGHVSNFSYLCEIAKDTQFDYFLFCDQDDVWLPNKIEVMLKECILFERQEGEDIPLLIHSDLIVVDSNLRTINSSFFKHQKLPNPNHHKVPKLLIQNVITGCASLINRELLNKATPLPRETVVHDWWFAIIASMIGETRFIDQGLIKYRQHENNAIGALTKRGLLQQFFKAIHHLKLSYLQASIVYSIYNSSYDNELKGFVYFHQLSFSDQRDLVHRIANNPNCKIEKMLIHLSLFLLAKFRKYK